jgi:uncharacterized protein YabE (DUF348 family)
LRRWGWGGLAIDKDRLTAAALRLGRLALVSCLVAAGTFAALAASVAPTAAAGPLRAATAARGAGSAPARQVRVSVDGLAAATWGTDTVETLLAGLGLAPRSSDRVSVARDSYLVPGERLALDRGVPLTLLDGGKPTAIRSPRVTVGELLAAEQVTLGAQDLVQPALDEMLVAGAVVRVTRVADREETLREPSPYAVRFIADPSLDRGQQVVVTPGEGGEVANTYRVRIVDGREVERTLLSSLEIAPAQDEVRRVGTRPPAAPAEIEAIIRQAAAANGADPDQLLRVAWCESRYNPNAFNPASGASGLFQFMPLTWSTNSVRAGYAGASPFDPVASANVAAWMFARGSANLWACK